MTARAAFALPFLLFSLAGCPAGPTYIVQQYGGPPRPRETIGILRVNGKDGVPLGTLDDEELTARIAEDTRLHIEVLPGRHTVSVRGGEVSQRIAFKVEAGKVYRVVIEGASKEPGSAAGSARAHEVDRDSDALGRDVTEVIDARPPPLPHEPTRDPNPEGAPVTD